MRTSDPDQAGASSTFRFDATLTRCCESRSKPNKSNHIYVHLNRLIS
jgi:hypothetical protein